MQNVFKKFWNQVRFEKKLTAEEVRDVRDDVERLQERGKLSSEIITYLQNNYPIKLGEKWEAERAYWTETKRLESMKVKEDARKLGIKRMRVEPNTNACPICIKLSGNGKKVFEQKDMSLDGRPFPPFHPGCYCIALPVIDE